MFVAGARRWPYAFGLALPEGPASFNSGNRLRGPGTRLLLVASRRSGPEFDRVDYRADRLGEQRPTPAAIRNVGRRGHFCSRSSGNRLAGGGPRLGYRKSNSVPVSGTL